MGPFSQPQWPSWSYSGMSDQFSNYSQFSNYPAYIADSLEAYQTHHSRLSQHQQMSRSTESKPRLSKEEVEVLETEFQKNHKPSSITKKALAESMRVDNARINNWFQNRRAREKKENNIKEYEAKQRLEKELGDASDGPQPESSRQCDLVASSAPFPQPATNLKQFAEASQSPSEQSLPDATSEASQSGESDLLSPIPLPIKQEMTGSLDPTKYNLLKVKPMQDEDDDDTCALSDQMDDYFSVQEGSLLGANTKLQDRQFFLDFAATEHKQQNMESYDRGLDMDMSAGSSPSDAGSPDAVDIASRRNRRPAPLSIGGGRSKSYTARTYDNCRRGEQTASMRRVSSSTGSGRIKKSVATPRSPFFDRNADDLFQRRPSPHTAGRHGSSAPPTPDTPVALQSQEAGALASALYSLNGKYTPPDLVISDPTLRTPPTTPGYSDGLFRITPGFNMTISEETLIAPGMGRLNGGINMAENRAAFATYLANNSHCSAQQMSTVFPTHQIGQNYFNFIGSGGDSDFSWSDLSPSTASTASSTQRYMSLNHIDN
ncbi:hypothetical protein QQS21_001540 [Conoideocrella luteorostrata]|uniref:Homeobox domain-containing protein n=1 Tax=Conoideocrella luteorostrata TaxID=1105319 RepID=A0AAJ0G3D6_9HYPO|nr:hypothetical protein QQS21_001540 [Conoideocrella luteorostrata]